jgi:hypothetical protein
MRKRNQKRDKGRKGKGRGEEEAERAENGARKGE